MIIDEVISDTMDNFDDYAENYRQIHSNNIKITGQESEYFSEYKILELKKILTLEKEKRILDVGCGDGISEFFFNQHFPENKVFGIDISASSIEIAKKKKLPNCTFNIYDGNTIPFGDSSFDLVFFACVLHHIPHQQHISLFRECMRVLNPDGYIVIFEHNPYNPMTKKIVRDCIFDKEAVLIKPYQLKQNLKEAGFNKISIRYTLFFPRHKIFKPFHLIERFLSPIAIGGQYIVYSQKDHA